MKALFVELPAFERNRSAYLTDEAFRGLQNAMLKDPEAGDSQTEITKLRKNPSEFLTLLEQTRKETGGGDKIKRVIKDMPNISLLVDSGSGRYGIFAGFSLKLKEFKLR